MNHVELLPAKDEDRVIPPGVQARGVLGYQRQTRKYIETLFNTLVQNCYSNYVSKKYL